MVEEGIRPIIFSSTAAVFGEPTETPITEAHDTRPINPYGETKLAIERALGHFERAYGLRSILRTQLPGWTMSSTYALLPETSLTPSTLRLVNRARG